MKKFSKIFAHHYKMANLSDGAIVLAYYVLLSLFPILIILGSIFRVFHFDANSLLQNLHYMLPESIRSSLEPILLSTLKGSGNGQLSFGIVITIWSASRAVAAFQRTVNGAYGVTKQPNAIFNRLTSFFWLFLIMILSVVVMAVFVVGQMVLSIILKVSPIDPHLAFLYQSGSWLVSLLIIFLLMNFLYRFVPSIKTYFKYTWVGSLLVAVGLWLLSQFFSLYIHYFMHSVTTYQTLSTFIILIFWLYLIGMVMLFCAVLNASIQEYYHGNIKTENIQIKNVNDTINKKLRKKDTPKH